MVLNDSVQKQRWGDNGERTKNRSSSWTSGSELQRRFFKVFFKGFCKLTSIGLGGPKNNKCAVNFLDFDFDLKIR